MFFVSMAKESMLEMNAQVVDILPGTQFKIVLLDDKFEPLSNTPIKGILSGKLRKNYIKIIENDYVSIEISPYDMNVGRIRRRLDPYEVRMVKSGKKDSISNIYDKGDSDSTN